jgi:four helix bundle protein
VDRLLGGEGIVVKYDQIEDLRIVKLAEEISDKIWDIAIKWPYFAKDTVGKQLVRSADSIGANISEGYGRHHKNDVIRFLYLSRGSLQETKFWIRRAGSRKLLSEDTAKRLLDDLNNLAPQLNAFISAKQKLG